MNRDFRREVHAADFGIRLRNNAENHLIERAVAPNCHGPWRRTEGAMMERLFTREQSRRVLLWDAAAEAVGKLGDAAGLSFGPPTIPQENG